MAITFDPAVLRPLPELVTAFNDAFRGYVGGEITLDTVSFGHFLHRQGVDLSASIVAMDDLGEVVGLALMGRRGWTARLAAMGVTSGAQEKGVGRALVDDLLRAARERGDRYVELEVIRTNPRGVRLYQGAGFRAVQALLGFELPALEAETGRASDAPVEVDPYLVAQAVGRYADEDTPWQASETLLSGFGSPVRGYRAGPAWAMTAPARAGKAALLAFVVEPGARGQGHGSRLLAALRALEPEAVLTVPPVCPERYRPFFERAGARVSELSQWQMRIGLQHS
jgi:ribosomal protein S18 acetylase RimI-like enzyme